MGASQSKPALPKQLGTIEEDEYEDQKMTISPKTTTTKRNIEEEEEEKEEIKAPITIPSLNLDSENLRKKANESQKIAVRKHQAEQQQKQNQEAAYKPAPQKLATEIKMRNPSPSLSQNEENQATSPNVSSASRVGLKKSFDTK